MNKRNVILILVAALISIGAAEWEWASRRWAAQPVAIGESAPGFERPTLDRGKASLRDHDGEVVVLNFWATWCPPCVEEAPSFETFAEQMRAEGVAVISVSVDQDTAALEKFVADHHLTFPVARDPDQVLAGRYGTFQFPETYILDRHGRVADKIIGAIDWQDPRIIDFVRELAHPSKRAAK